MDKFEIAHRGDADVWDYQWFYTVMLNNGLSIAPNVNLVKNIGFEDNATHTKKYKKKFFSCKLEEISNIVHPEFILPDTIADIFTFKNVYSNWLKVFIKMVLRKLKVKYRF